MHTLVDCTQYLQDQNDRYKWEGEYGQNYSTAILVKLTNHCMNSYRELCPKHHHTAPEVTKRYSHSTWCFNNEGMIILTEANGHGEFQQSGRFPTPSCDSISDTTVHIHCTRVQRSYRSTPPTYRKNKSVTSYQHPHLSTT